MPLSFITRSETSTLIELPLGNTTVQKEQWINFHSLNSQQQKSNLTSYAMQIDGDGEWVTNVSSWHSTMKIELLIKQLADKGPMSITGKFGRFFYENEADLTQKISERDVYGWKPGSKRVEHDGTTNTVLLVGAAILDKKEFVFFVDPQNPIDQQNAKIRKIYAISYNNLCSNAQELPTLGRLQFGYHLKQKEVTRAATIPQETKPTPVQRSAIFSDVDAFDLGSLLSRYGNNVCGFSSAPTKKQELTKDELEYVTRLESLPLKGILRKDEIRKQCKDIGQEIFDRYKNEVRGNSFAGKKQAQLICNALHFRGQDGKLRKQYVENAWDGIGDEIWRWMA